MACHYVGAWIVCDLAALRCDFSVTGAWIRCGFG